jgi:F420-non-reducing hydrogenase iron-sulfur subunit
LSDYKPKIVCFSCKFGWGYLTDEVTLAKEIENWVPIICTGKIDSTHIINAFNEGADGVLILGCPEGDCHYQDGNYETRKKVHLLRNLLETMGIEKARIRIELSVDPEGKRISQLVKEMSKDLMKLSPPKTKAAAGKTPAKEMIKAKGGK